ncbi:hypothetical protein CRENPOLYSF2_1160002 [Crenothrix polyspora]|uniref:Uncharacterized protein n=1 Tax=Crenothrix polyspora TaxID=360316 RepID=A0A1R4GZN3_9GAMM|nr:hypothetical protein CRENPOLYSF2_1160002 [Crenothrix polyspora]
MKKAAGIDTDDMGLYLHAFKPVKFMFHLITNSVPLYIIYTIPNVPKKSKVCQ